MPGSSVTKAVIPAAGLGTRFLPATKAQPKEMLPVVDKPAIQYVVEEAVAAGHRRHPHHHRPQQAHPRGPLRPQLRARVLPRAERDKTGPARGGPAPRRAGRHPLRPPGRAARASATPCRWPASTSGDNPFVVMLGDDIMDRQLHGAHRHDLDLRALRPVGDRAVGVPGRGDLLLRLRRPRGRQRRAGAASSTSSRSRSRRTRRRTWPSWVATSSPRRSSTPSRACSPASAARSS